MASPSVSLNSPSNSGTVNTATPELQFTGTDADGDAITYETQVDTVDTFNSQPSGSHNIDYYPESNASDGYAALGSLDNFGAAQSFTGDGATITSVKFYVRKSSSPTGNAYAKLYSHSGTYGTSSVPGTLLATSDPVGVSTISTSYSLVEFTFSGANQYATTNGTYYVISIEYSGSGGYLALGIDYDSPAHSGNASFTDDGTNWGADNTTDLLFYVIGTSYSPLVDAISSTDAGFSGSPDNTDPFTSGQAVTYTVQAGDALTSGSTYYWRVRGKDPAGSNTFGAWATTRSFTVSVGTVNTSTESAIARIATNRSAAQTAAATVLGVSAKTQTATASIVGVLTSTQPAIARISSTYTSTAGAITRIANDKTATIAATARVYGILTKTQTATAKITVTRVASISGTAYITYPAELMTRYDYKVYRGGTFVGLLPVVSEYLAAQDINTAGSQITIEVAQTADTARIAATTTIDDESGVPLQDEAGNDLLTEGAINVVGLGADTTIVKNGNWVKVIEYSKWHPNGIVAFHGKMVRFEAPLGSDNDTETIKVLCNSTGEDLNNHCIKTSGGDTTVSFTTVDPSTGMLADSMDIYIAEGGLVSYTGSTIDSTGLSLSASFNTNTMFEAIGTFHSLSPDDFYWYVGLGDDLLYFKQSSATPDIYLDKGSVINQSTLVVSIENTVNQLLFTGGDAGGGSNLFRKYEDATSQSQFGVLLDRRNDNRVVLTATANAIGNTSIASSKGEQSQTPITILGDKIDLTTLHLGMTVGFRGSGTFVDNLVYRIVRIIRYPDKADIIIGTLPPRTTVTMAQIMRNLIAQDTINNPVAPS